ncbi:FMN-binding protein [Blastococcus sp. TF02A-26]|uniref:FMN-binding protein n=1 Tax=Blastococcus sp. TF02A-26 TaxID=2250577 RepID=UPI000DE92008|nr:FMN-binding protein [Blastococcus sp. TF02A-26]RBY87009.1 FMN-binding protein [Blastococcus sp. TF02A-26]
MRRIVLWFMSTLTVLVLVFGYHTSTSSHTPVADSSVLAPVIGSVPSGTAAATSQEGAGGAVDTVTGDAVQTRWGPVQVELSVQDGAITAVSVLQYPDDNGRDREINARALPILVRETLDAQGSDIDMVSGATVASRGYLQSLQSALDEAGL